jgi:hypothetical protein
MSSAVLFQRNGFGSWFQLLSHCRTSCARTTTLWWTPGRMSWLVSSPNQRSTWFVQDEPFGVKCRWKREWRASQSRMAGVLWVARVVADQVHVQVGGDGDDELAELHRRDPPVPGPAGAGQQRRPDDRGGVGPARSNHGGQQHVGDTARAAADPPPAAPACCRHGRAPCGCGRDPTGAAGKHCRVSSVC